MIGLNKIHVAPPATPERRPHWTCISFAGVAAFDTSMETMNGEKYCTILNEKVVPFFT